MIQKDSNRDQIKRRVATSREVDRHEYDAINLHSEPPPFIFLPRDAFYFGLRDVFRACFFVRTFKRTRRDFKKEIGREEELHSKEILHNW